MKIAETNLAHASLGKESACYSNDLAFKLGVVVPDLVRVMCDVVGQLLKRVLPVVLQDSKLVHTNLHLLDDFGFGELNFFLGVNLLYFVILHVGTPKISRRIVAWFCFSFRKKTREFKLARFFCKTGSN